MGAECRQARVRAVEVLVCGVVAAFAGCGLPRPIARASVAPADGSPDWHYEGDEGPAHWGDLVPAFSACGRGRRQSPIAIRAEEPADPAPALRLRFPATLRIAHHEHVADGLNNGHTIQVKYDDGDTLTVGAQPYALVQYHFHHPSEHTIAGQRYAMEMHMVHRTPAGAMAVVAVLIHEGHHNAAFDPVWTNLPNRKGSETHYEHVPVDVDALLPARHASYRYEGSLTTPPCTEGVQWFVLVDPIELSPDQVRAFATLIPDNSRPVQPLNGRVVLTDSLR